MNPRRDDSTPENPRGAFEDVNFITLTTKMTQTGEMLPEQVDRIRFLVDQRAKHPKWGFKSALTHRVFDQIRPYLPDPHLILVLRCPLATARSTIAFHRKRLGTDLGLGRALHLVAKDQAAVAALALSGLPYMAVAKPSSDETFAQTVDKLGAFLGQPRSSVKAIQEKLWIPGYSSWNHSQS